jgi:hypothetical protein
MKRRPLLIAIAAIVAFGAWYAFRPERLFINETVNESLAEVSAPAATGSADAAHSGTAAAVVTGPMTLAAGQFHSNAHETKGTATVLQLADGRRVLRLTGFETSNGPDVRVYLVASDDVQDDATVKQAGFVELGALKGNRGDQNYELPANVDLAQFRTVTIWCKRFSVNFGSAPLARS